MYLVLKLVHVLAVVMFMGNITTGLFWKHHADRTRDPRLIAHVIEGIIRSDRWFTLPGVLIIIIAGFGAAGIGHLKLLGTGWIFWSIVLFTISGIAYMAQVAPLQKKMATLMREGAASGSPDWARYQKLSTDWNLWGAIALITPLIALILMVLKPELPGL